MTERPADAYAAAEGAARRSYGKLVALLAAGSGDVAAAEDALSEAFSRALADWPAHGTPANPEAWLLTVARRKAIDGARRAQRGELAAQHLRLPGEPPVAPGTEPAIPDHRLALLFTCAHPAIDPAIHAPLMLQVVLGLDARLIASAFLTSPAAMGKRLVRAKERIRQAGIPFRVPEREELPARLPPVLDAIYAAFTTGWNDPGGTDLTRRDLADEALFLARLVNELLPGEPEALGLLALLSYAESRRKARRSAEGEYVPLSEQDPAAWDARLLAEAEALLRQAATLGAVGRYQLEAALQSAHVERCLTRRPNWEAVSRLYHALAALRSSPVVTVNRALATAELEGAERALARLDEVAGDPRLAEYQPYWAVRAELLGRVGSYVHARAAYQRAIGLENDPAVRRFLQRRMAGLPE